MLKDDIASKESWMYISQIVTKCDQTVFSDTIHWVRIGIKNRYGAGIWGLPGGGRTAAARATCAGGYNGKWITERQEGGKRETKGHFQRNFTPYSILDLIFQLNGKCSMNLTIF